MKSVVRHYPFLIAIDTINKGEKESGVYYIRVDEKRYFARRCQSKKIPGLYNFLPHLPTVGEM